MNEIPFGASHETKGKEEIEMKTLSTPLKKIETLSPPLQRVIPESPIYQVPGAHGGAIRKKKKDHDVQDISGTFFSDSTLPSSTNDRYVPMGARSCFAGMDNIIDSDDENKYENEGIPIEGLIDTAYTALRQIRRGTPEKMNEGGSTLSGKSKYPEPGPTP